jgi:hypothetical protein
VNRLPVVLQQPLLVRVVLGKPPCRHHDPVIVGERPQPIVEEPVRVLAQRQAVVRVVLLRESAKWWIWAASTI